MNKSVLIAEKLFDGERYHHHCAITIEQGKILDIRAADKSMPADLIGTVYPGLIDVQVNGGGGAFFNADPSISAINTIGKAHAAFGTTGFLPTLITDHIKVIEQAANAVSDALSMGSPGLLGVHFEGPHLSVPKKGVHPAKHIRHITDAELAIYCRADLGKTVLTLAPENVPSDIIRDLVNQGVIVCLGHSNADYDTVENALAAGATGFTHLFNAMSPFQSRQPGMVGSALLDSHSWCGLIVDGYHVHPSAAKLAIKAKSKGKIMLVTDAMSLVGTDENSFELFGDKVMRRGDKLNAPDGALAGSMLDMASAVRNTHHDLGVSIDESVRMASLYPAAFLGEDEHYGRLTPGYSADFILVDDDFRVQKTAIKGQFVTGN